VVDPRGTWAHPTWHELSFEIASPHRYSYEFVTDGARFIARALGDLDGDGVLSTFERTGQIGPDGAVVISDLRVVNELE
jgi:hypothetical protein